MEGKEKRKFAEDLTRKLAEDPKSGWKRVFADNENGPECFIPEKDLPHQPAVVNAVNVTDEALIETISRNRSRIRKALGLD